MTEQTEAKGLLNGERKSYRRYGSTISNTHKPDHVVCHQVKKEDTIQGIALRYGVTVEMVKFHNKLWSPESIYLYDYLEVPVTKAVYEAFSTLCQPAVKYKESHGRANGLQKKSMECSQSLSPNSTRYSSSQKSAVYDCSEQTPNEILTKIDTNIALMKSNIYKMENYKSPIVDKMEIDDGHCRNGQSKDQGYPKCWDQRPWDDCTSSSKSQSPANITMSLKRLLKEQEDLYQL